LHTTEKSLPKRQILKENMDHELSGGVEIKRIKLESSLNAEIAISLVMVDIPYQRGM